MQSDKAASEPLRHIEPFIDQRQELESAAHGEGRRTDVPKVHRAALCACSCVQCLFVRFVKPFGPSDRQADSSGRRSITRRTSAHKPFTLSCSARVQSEFGSCGYTSANPDVSSMFKNAAIAKLRNAVINRLYGDFGVGGARAARSR